MRAGLAMLPAVIAGFAKTGHSLENANQIKSRRNVLPRPLSPVNALILRPNLYSRSGNGPTFLRDSLEIMLQLLLMAYCARSNQRSAPVGYAAEYLILASLCLHMCISPLMLYRILYHFPGNPCPPQINQFFSHAIQTKVRLPQRRQHPSTNEQSTHKRIQTPPVCSYNVQKYSPIRGHVNCCQCENVTNYQYSTTNSFPCITCQLFNHPTEHPALQR